MKWCALAHKCPSSEGVGVMKITLHDVKTMLKIYKKTFPIWSLWRGARTHESEFRSPSYSLWKDQHYRQDHSGQICNYIKKGSSKLIEKEKSWSGLLVNRIFKRGSKFKSSQTKYCKWVFFTNKIPFATTSHLSCLPGSLSLHHLRLRLVIPIIPELQNPNGCDTQPQSLRQRSPSLYKYVILVQHLPSIIFSSHTHTQYTPCLYI